MADPVQVKEEKQCMERGGWKCSVAEHESTDWAGTKGQCVAGKGTSMGHWLSNTQEGKSCENGVLPANN